MANFEKVILRSFCAKRGEIFQFFREVGLKKKSLDFLQFSFYRKKIDS